MIHSSNKFFRLALAAVTFAAIACKDTTSAGIDLAATEAAQSKTAPAYEVVDLGRFGSGQTLGLIIDKHGSIFGRFTRTGGGNGSFQWTDKGGYRDLGSFDGNTFLILNANDHGLLTGNTLTGQGVFVPGVPNVQRAVAWSKEDGFFYLDAPNTGNSFGSNERGAVAGTRTGGGFSTAFVWTKETGVQLLPLDLPGRTIVNSGSSDVNDDGAVAGTVVSRVTGGLPNTTTIRGFVWDEINGTTIIPTLGPAAPGPRGFANLGVTSISDEGLVLGASETRNPIAGDVRVTPVGTNTGTIPIHAWKWSAATGLVDLGTLGGTHSVAWNSDRDGNVFGWARDASGRRHAVKWTAAGHIIDLGSLGGDAVTGGLNKHGVVTGWAIAPGGASHVVRFDPTK